MVDEHLSDLLAHLQLELQCTLSVIFLMESLTDSFLLHQTHRVSKANSKVAHEYSHWVTHSLTHTTCVSGGTYRTSVVCSTPCLQLVDLCAEIHVWACWQTGHTDVMEFRIRASPSGCAGAKMQRGVAKRCVVSYAHTNKLANQRANKMHKQTNAHGRRRNTN